MDDVNRDLLWDISDRQVAFDGGILTLVRHHAVHPRTKAEGEFFVFRTVDWVNVIALTAADEIITVRQFRHGIEQVTLEIPGGMVDEGEGALQAAQRELREETGYASNDWVELACVAPNPATQSNRCTLFLARNAEKTTAPQLDPTEVMVTELHPVANLRDLITQGAFVHALSLSAFTFFLLSDQCS